MVRVTGTILVGSSGAITSYDAPGCIVKLVSGKTGRYSVQLIDQDGTTVAVPSQPTLASAAVEPFGIQAISCIVASSVADNALTTDGALHVAVRNLKPLTGYFELQCYKDLTATSSETHTDTHPASGDRLMFGFDVKLSSVTP